MEPADYLGAITQNANDLADAAEQAGLDARVPSCPKWAATDLLEHIGTVHRWALANTKRSPGDPFLPTTELGLEVPPGPERASGSGMARPRSSRRSIARPMPQPGHGPAPNTIAFWQRRQAHETAMHRVDAQLAAGDVTANRRTARGRRHRRAPRDRSVAAVGASDHRKRRDDPPALHRRRWRVARAPRADGRRGRAGAREGRCGGAGEQRPTCSAGSRDAPMLTHSRCSDQRPCSPTSTRRCASSRG